MGPFNAAALLITLAGLFSWVKYRFIRLPATIAMLLFALATSLGVVALGRLGVGSEALAQQVLGGVQAGQALLEGMISMLLLAAELRVNLGESAHGKWGVGFLARRGVVVSTALVGIASFAIFAAL